MRGILPNVLTIFRVLIIPAIVSSFYMKGGYAQYVTLMIFLLACITDFLDGYLARMWGVQSKFGRFFDPAADKLIVLSTGVMLVYVGKITGACVIFTIVIICREVLVSGMREFFTTANVSIPVSGMGKLKTVTQMVATGLLIVDDVFLVRVGEVFLFISAVLSVHSMCLYTRTALTKIGSF